MATIVRQAAGRKMIQFTGADRKKRSLRLGKVSQRQALVVKLHVERLLAAQRTGHVADEDTLAWLINLDVVLIDRLASVGLVDRQRTATLGEFIDQYIAGRTDVQSSTATVYGHTR